MNINNHIDKRLEKMIGSYVIIEFKDGTSEHGVLTHNTSPGPTYKLICSEKDVVFYKSHFINAYLRRNEFYDYR